MELLIFPLISALASLSIAHFYVLPRWMYKTKLMNVKPFSCVTCLAFWISVIFSLPLMEYKMYFLLPIVGLASSAITILILEKLKI